MSVIHFLTAVNTMNLSYKLVYMYTTNTHQTSKHSLCGHRVPRKKSTGTEVKTVLDAKSL